MNKEKVLELAEQSGLEYNFDPMLWLKYEKFAELISRECTQENDFNPDWDEMAAMVEHQQRMAERVQEIDAVVAQLVDALRLAQSMMHSMEWQINSLWVIDETPESLDLIERKIAAALAAAKEAGL